MNEIYPLIQLYQKLNQMTRERKCSWEQSSEINSYYLQLQSSVIRIGEKEELSSNDKTYTFQIIKDGESEVNRKVDHSFSEEYNVLMSLYSSIRVYYLNNIQSVVSHVEDELDKL